jgi:hypothetical protein
LRIRSPSSLTDARPGTDSIKKCLRICNRLVLNFYLCLYVLG